MGDQIHLEAMTTYRFFAVDELDAVTCVHWIECENDGSAKEIAGSLLADGCDIEVWDVGRRVCKCTLRDRL